MTTSSFSVHAGFIPLVDCAPLVVAKELGFALEEGIALELHREVSWANIRDKVNVGIYDCAHMLAPMPIAATCGIGHVQEHIIAPVNLSYNGNAITVSEGLFREMEQADVANANAGPKEAAHSIAGVIRQRVSSGQPPLTFGIVYPFSSHSYELRYWLASAGIHPDLDIRLVVIPPSLMAASLQAGHIQGYCAGEPWNSVAVEQANGRIIATKQELWSKAPEKVLGVRKDWAEKNKQALLGLIRALVSAARWLDDPSNIWPAAEMLARPEYLNVPATTIKRSLDGELPRLRTQEAIKEADFIAFSSNGSLRPSEAYAIWLLAQMARWGEITTTFDFSTAVQSTYGAALYAQALGEDLPLQNEVDRKICAVAEFEPDAVAQYLRRFAICANKAQLSLVAQAQRNQIKI